MYIIPNFVLFVTSFENTCKAMVSHNEEVTWVPSYPRKRVSRLIGRRPNLDSRVRGNDESRREFPRFSFSVGVREIMINFVVKTLSHLVAAMPR